MHYRTDYSPALLTSAPRVLQLGDWCLHYQAYASRSNDRRAPVLLLGGAFQSFRSFASEVAELLGDHPVILLDLTSQGLVFTQGFHSRIDQKAKRAVLAQRSGTLL